MFTKYLWKYRHTTVKKYGYDNLNEKNGSKFVQKRAELALPLWKLVIF